MASPSELLPSGVLGSEEPPPAAPPLLAVAPEAPPPSLPFLAGLSRVLPPSDEIGGSDRPAMKMGSGTHLGGD